MMHLVNRFYADSDGKQYILMREREGTRKKPTEGEKETYTYYSCEGFFSNLADLLRSCCKKCVMEKVQSAEVETLAGWIAAAEAVRDEIIKAVGGGFDEALKGAAAHGSD